MDSLSIHQTDQYIDLNFNAWLVVILIFMYTCATISPRLLLVVVLGVSAAIITFDNTSTIPQMIKTLALLPFGLGSILAFLSMNQSFKTTYLRAFTIYVNFAVYGNIMMMIGTPTGSTMRGMLGKVTTLALWAWVVLQGYQVGWKTVIAHDKIFYFRAVSKSWVFAHAVYRFILLTLPVFGSGRRHRLLEAYSLGMTFALSSAFNVPFEYCFGMADTLVVPAEAAWSSLATTFNLIPRDGRKLILSGTADALLGILTLSVAAFASFNVYTGWSRISEKRK